LLCGRPLSNNYEDDIRYSMEDISIYAQANKKESPSFYESGKLQQAVYALLLGDKLSFENIVHNEGKKFTQYPLAKPFLEATILVDSEQKSSLVKEYSKIIYEAALPQVPADLLQFLHAFFPLPVVTLTILKSLYVDKTVSSLDQINGNEIMENILSSNR
jgi:hypothetical protein